MAVKLTASYLEDALVLLEQYKRMGEGAMAQVRDDELGRAIDEEANSIAVLVKHLAGNMRSRWTDFLNSDGEKPDRNRDGEFVIAPASRAELMAMWDEGWKCVFDALRPLSDADLARTVTIRGEAHTAMQAIHRQVAHYACHVGQIMLLAKHFRGREWKTLSIARGASKAFNAQVRSGS